MKDDKSFTKQEVCSSYVFEKHICVKRIHHEETTFERIYT